MRTVQIALEGASFVDVSAYGLWCNDWDFPAPVPKTTFLNITGTDGSIDVSDIFRGEVALNDVNATLSFFVRTPALFDYEEFKTLYHGRRVKIKNSEFPDTYRVGRMWVESVDRARRIREVTCKMVADPYAYSMTETTVTQSFAPTETPTAVVDSYGGAAVGANLSTTPIEGYAELGYVMWLIGSSSSPFERGYGIFSIPIEAGKGYHMSFTGRGGYRGDHIFTAYLADGTEVFRGTTSWQYGYVPCNVTFSSGQNTTLYIRIDGEDIYYGGSPRICSVTKFRLNDAPPVEATNNGRKLLIPTAIATADCTVHGATGDVDLTAGVEATLFNAPLFNGDNDVYVYSENSGSITLRWREGHL